MLSQRLSTLPPCEDKISDVEHICSVGGGKRRTLRHAGAGVGIEAIHTFVGGDITDVGAFS